MQTKPVALRILDIVSIILLGIATYHGAQCADRTA